MNSKKKLLVFIFAFYVCLCIPQMKVSATEKYTFETIVGTKYVSKETNIRTEPSLDGEKVGVLSAEESFYTFGRCNETGWYKIFYDGEYRYISDLYVMDFTVYINHDYLHIFSPVDIRKWPDDSSEIVGHIPADVNLKMTGITTDQKYYEVNYQTSTGFIPASSTRAVVSENKYKYTTIKTPQTESKKEEKEKEKPSAFKVIVIIFCVIWGLGKVCEALSMIVDSKDSSKRTTQKTSGKKDDFSLFGVDWDGDGKVSMVDDFITMDLLDEDK